MVSLPLTLTLTIGDECAQGSGVGLGVARGEALVGLG